MIHMVGSGNLTGSFLGVGWEILHIGQGEGKKESKKQKFQGIVLKIPSGRSCHALLPKNWNSFLLT